ncbi:MAG: hypothetical protein H8D45_27925 [Bacteroidetes bacterium]|nr:hypothetical protein [Bacteroidota bacterium]MBL7103490.1 hypothetical protein [Bacteroidales bacterium]
MNKIQIERLRSFVKKLKKESYLFIFIGVFLILVFLLYYLVDNVCVNLGVSNKHIVGIQSILLVSLAFLIERIYKKVSFKRNFFRHFRFYNINGWYIYLTDKNYNKIKTKFNEPEKLINHRQEIYTSTYYSYFNKSLNTYNPPNNSSKLIKQYLVELRKNDYKQFLKFSYFDFKQKSAYKYAADILYFHNIIYKFGEIEFFNRNNDDLEINAFNSSALDKGQILKPRVKSDFFYAKIYYKKATYFIDIHNVKMIIGSMFEFVVVTNSNTFLFKKGKITVLSNYKFIRDKNKNIE